MVDECPTRRHRAVVNGAIGAVVFMAVIGGRPLAEGPQRGAEAPETRVAGIAIERSTGERERSFTESRPPTAPADPPADPPAGASGGVTGLEVLAAIDYPWRARLPGWEIEFVPPRPGYRGSTFPRERRIQIYLRDGLTLDELVHTTAHEIGHAIDVTLLDEADRAGWKLARGRAESDAWWVESGTDDFSSGSGDWAESFAWRQAPGRHWYSRVGPAPTADQLGLMDVLVGR